MIENDWEGVEQKDDNEYYTEVYQITAGFFRKLIPNLDRLKDVLNIKMQDYCKKLHLHQSQYPNIGDIEAITERFGLVSMFRMVDEYNVLSIKSQYKYLRLLKGAILMQYEELEELNNKNRNPNDKNLEIALQQVKDELNKDIFKGLRPNQIFLEEFYHPDSKVTRNVSESVSITPELISQELFTKKLQYLKRIVSQINASYRYELYDCCAVMCRRLLILLIIELFESKEKLKLIFNNDEYLPLPTMIDQLKKEYPGQFTNHSGLLRLKSLGDRAAHHRRAFTDKDNIDKLHDDFNTNIKTLVSLILD